MWAVPPAMSREPLRSLNASTGADKAGQVLASSLPHVRGGVSASGAQLMAEARSSPRAWGCFLYCGSGCQFDGVFPTCVGVFLAGCGRTTHYRCLPHVRGGVSPPKQRLFAVARSSPRAWGCFKEEPPPLEGCLVFPTCVGVFPRRGESISALGVFPTCVGVFPVSELPYI